MISFNRDKGRYCYVVVGRVAYRRAVILLYGEILVVVKSLSWWNDYAVKLSLRWKCRMVKLSRDEFSML